ncbi:hypothetical protein [Escherichia sp. E1130]|uniref:hypothetical protein n=1 Tax=Escherichia sp. E1130 TaxID=2041645 RepID=UPI00108130C9|nr:hypothetical protein [Escherichia sp. E1130]TGC20907.1 hypothetical protein CQJ27_25735 [Escherichia sp. E1130]
MCKLLGIGEESESALTEAMRLSDTIMGASLAPGEGSAEGRLYAGGSYRTTAQQQSSYGMQTSQTSTQPAGFTDQDTGIHSGVNSSSPHVGERGSWRPVTTIDGADFDFPAGKRLEYTFSYVRNGQTVTRNGSVRVPAGQRGNRTWHGYFSQQINRIIYEDDDLNGVFDVQYRGDRDNLSYVSGHSHYNAVYASTASQVSAPTFTWRIAEGPAGQSAVPEAPWDNDKMSVHTGVQRNNRVRTHQGWRPLNTLNLSRFDLPPATKIGYAFSYEIMENGKSRTVVKRGFITPNTRGTRHWHYAYATELNSIISGDPDLNGIFRVDYQVWESGGHVITWAGVQKSHFNAVYMNENKSRERGYSNSRFSWMLVPETSQLAPQPTEHTPQLQADLHIEADESKAREGETSEFMTELLAFVPVNASTPSTPLGTLMQSEGDAFRFFLQKYPQLASLTGVTVGERDEKRLLAASRQWYGQLSGLQQYHFDITVAFLWKLKIDPGFRTQAQEPHSFALYENLLREHDNSVKAVLETRNEDATYVRRMTLYDQLNKARSDLNVSSDTKVTSSQEMLQDVTPVTDDDVAVAANRDKLSAELEEMRAEAAYLSKYSHLRKNTKPKAPVAAAPDETEAVQGTPPLLESASSSADDWIVKSANDLGLNINKDDLDNVITITWRNAYSSSGEEFVSGLEQMTLRDVLLGEFARKIDSTPEGVSISNIHYGFEANPAIANYLNQHHRSAADMTGDLAIADGVQSKATEAFNQIANRPGVGAAFEKATSAQVLSVIVREADKLADQDPVYEEIIMHYLRESAKGGSSLQAVIFDGKTVPGLVAIGQGDFRVIISLHKGEMFLFNACASDSYLTALIKEHVAEVDSGTVTDDAVLPWYSETVTTSQGTQTRSHLKTTRLTFSAAGGAFTVPEGASHTTVMAANITRARSELDGMIYSSEESLAKQANDRREFGLGLLKFTLGAMTFAATAPEMIMLGGLIVLADRESVSGAREAASRADRSTDRMKAENDARQGEISMYGDAILGVAGPLLHSAWRAASVLEFAKDAKRFAAPGSWSKPVDFSKYTARDASYLGLGQQVPDANGVYSVTQPGGVGMQYFIQEDGVFYRVKFDDHLGRKQGTIRLVDENRNYNTGYHEPVRRNAQGTGWELHNDTGLPGGVGGSTSIPPGDQTWRNTPEKNFIYKIGTNEDSSPDLLERHARSSRATRGIPQENFFADVAQDPLAHRRSAPFNVIDGGSLSSLDKNSRLDVSAHGNRNGPVAGLNNITAKELVDKLWDAGLREVGVLRVDACNVGNGAYLLQLKTALNAKGIRFGYIAAPNGLLMIAPEIKSGQNFIPSKGVLRWNIFGRPWSSIKGNLDVEFSDTDWL